MIIVSNGHETLEKYLINWNENKADAEKRNYDFSKDFFDFFRAINTCMLGDFNAWVHYAAKRYYALLGDGTTGAGSSGSITKRGYIMAHFAKFVTGMTRIDIDFGATPLEGSAFLSQTGDTVVAVVANASLAELAGCVRSHSVRRPRHYHHHVRRHYAS